MNISILGTEYEILKKTADTDCLLETMEGYCDNTTKKIVVSRMIPQPGSTVNIDVKEKAVLRHEIIHAFMYESGLHECSEWGTDETLIDWIALQYPKMNKVFSELGIED